MEEFLANQADGNSQTGGLKGDNSRMLDDQSEEQSSEVQESQPGEMKVGMEVQQPNKTQVGMQQNDPIFSSSPSSIAGALENNPEEDPVRLMWKAKLEEKIADGQELSQEDRKWQKLLGLTDKKEDKEEDKKEDKKEELPQVSKDLKDGTISVNNDQNINASNVTITAQSVTMDGELHVDGERQEKTDKKEEKEHEEENKEGKDIKEEAKKDYLEDFRLDLGFRDKFNQIRDIAELNGADTQVAEAGNEMYKDINAIRDTFYVDGQAPKDWQNTAGLTDSAIKDKKEKNKEKTEKTEKDWVKNKDNKQAVIENLKIDGKSMTDYYRDMYPEKSEAYVQNQVENRAEQELEKMKEYSHYGLTAEQALPIYQQQKKYGQTPEEAMRNYIGFQKFNKDSENVNSVNTTFKEALEKASKEAGIEIKATSIEDAIPNAQEYYNRGCKDINNMITTHAIQQQLDVSAEMAIKIDEVMRKRGSIAATAQKQGESDADYQARVAKYESISRIYERAKNEGKI